MLQSLSGQRSVVRIHVQPEQLTPEARCPHLPPLGGSKSPSLNCVPALFTPHGIVPGKRMSFGRSIFFSYRDHFMFLWEALCVFLRHFTLSLVLFSSRDLKNPNILLHIMKQSGDPDIIKRGHDLISNACLQITVFSHPKVFDHNSLLL